MGVITNGSGGGAGGGIRYNAQTDMIQVKVNGTWVDTPYKAYGTFDGTLYDGGVQAVPWDNTGYPSSTSATGWQGAVLSADSFKFNLPVAGENYAIITNDKIDLTGFNTLKCICNGTAYSLDVSQISESAYCIVNCYANGADWYYYLTASRTKEYYNQNQFNQTAGGYLPHGARGTTMPSFTKVWLE